MNKYNPKMKYTLFTVALVACISCVPLKQYQDLQKKNDSDRIELNTLSDENEKLSVDFREAKSNADRLQKLVQQLEKDTVRLARENWNLKMKNQEMEEQYNEYLKDLKGKSNLKSNSELLAHLQDLHNQLQLREDELIKAEKELDAKRERLEESKANLDELKVSLDALNDELKSRNKRLFELEKALSEKDSLMNALKTTVADALTGFGSDELEVHIKNGKVYVSMEEKLLFTSGSYQVSQAGVTALKKISAVLEHKTDINVMVEGHTDNVPYKSSVLLDNWDLSVKRATSVIRILLSGSSIDPARVTAAGRSEYIPLDNRNTTNARRKNRRTEIVLSPKLDQIFEMLQTN